MPLPTRQPADPRRPGQSLADAFAYVDDVYRVARLAIAVTVRSLDRTTRRRYAHERAWDHASRPGRHFLASPFGCLDRAWVTFLPREHATNPDARGVLFHLHVLDAGGPIEPALMVGSLDPGPAGFAAIHPRAVVRCIRHVESASINRPGLHVRRHGPLAIVTSDEPGAFAKVVLLRVPLDHLACYRDLLQAVIRPLLALLAGDIDLAAGLLEHIATLDWPDAQVCDGEADSDVEAA